MCPLHLKLCTPPGAAVFCIPPKLLSVLAFEIDQQPETNCAYNTDKPIQRSKTGCKVSKGRANRLAQPDELMCKIVTRRQPVGCPQLEERPQDEQISEYAYDGEFITWTTDGANAGTVFFRNGKFSITNVCGLLSPKNGDLNLRYLYYVLSKDARQYVNKGMGNAKLMSNVMGGIKIAVPPLSIQNRIANVLDNFDAICSDLNMGLPAEIEARQKQYEYYRDKLLTFKERISI